MLSIAAGLLVLGGIIGGIGMLLGGGFGSLWDVVQFNQVSFDGGQVWDSAFHESGEYETAADGIQRIDLQWMAGSVRVRAYDGADICWSERSEKTLDETSCLRWGVKGQTLYIQYCQRGVHRNLPAKDLELLVPRTLAQAWENFAFDGASADLDMQGFCVTELDCSSTSGRLQLTQMDCRQAELETTSGDIKFEGQMGSCDADTTSGAVELVHTGSQAAAVTLSSTSGDLCLSGAFSSVDVSTTSGAVRSQGAFSAARVEVETTSGDVALDGSMDGVDAESVSGAVSITSSRCPAELDVETTSGTVVLTIPADSGFTLEADTLSGRVDCQMPVQMRGDTYLCGDGAAEFEISTTSGDIQIIAR